MEGNECYKLTTVRNYVEKTAAAPIRVAVDVGCNVADVTLLMRHYFPAARVFAFEAVAEYYRHASRRMGDDPGVKVFQAAVCGLHRFEDDAGTRPRPEPTTMKILKGRPGAGIGWRGGSMVVTAERECENYARYEPQDEDVLPITLDEVLQLTTILTGLPEIDYLKMDCEGCECDALGCASLETLRRIRFIGGEYHCATRFHKMLREKLFQTHYVQMIGEQAGSFFCERIGEERTILKPSRDDMLALRPEMSDQPLDWHPFREEFVLPYEREAHGL